MQKTIEEIIYKETNERIKEMKKKKYIFPPKITKIDIVAIILLITISITLIILCMIGVII